MLQEVLRLQVKSPLPCPVPVSCVQTMFANLCTEVAHNTIKVSWKAVYSYTTQGHVHHMATTWALLEHHMATT